MTKSTAESSKKHQISPISQRFRGFLPVVIDVETGGTDPNKDALLEIAAITLSLNPHGLMELDETFHHHVKPFEGGNLDPKALAFNKIDPLHPFRFAIDENEALKQLFTFVKEAKKQNHCTRAVLVGHNAWFDLAFVKAAALRCKKIKHFPFHGFTSFDTATLSGLAFGQTVLSKAALLAGISFDETDAHSAIYDAKKTAELFCFIVNKWQKLGGWPL